jgi:hypothetical protein
MLKFERRTRHFIHQKPVSMWETLWYRGPCLRMGVTKDGELRWGATCSRPS